MTELERIDLLDEMVVSIQAEISAFKEILRTDYPELAKRHQQLVDELRPNFLRARQRNLE